MGCVFNFQRLEAKTAQEARTEGEAVISQAAWEHGHGGYTGSFAEANGLHVEKPKLADAEEAEKWLDDNCEKWGPALLVQDASGTWCMGAHCSS